MVLVVLSVVVLGATLVLPEVKSPQTVHGTVPTWAATPQQSDQNHGYGIPPVVPGSSVNVTLSGFEPRQLEYSLSPTIGNTVLPAIALGKVGDGPTFSFEETVSQGYSLELTIISYNGSGFTISLSGVWSPYDLLRVYTAPAIFLLTASLLATYYFGTRIPRQLAEEKVEAELEAQGKGRT